MSARRLTAILSLILLLTQGGCAVSPHFPAPVPDVKPMRKARSAQLLKEYEQRRDDAQYQAAFSAWEQGNTESCRELIDTLLERTPAHRNGRLLLVQLQLLEQELTEASAEADKLAKDFPADGEVLHTQGLVCEAAGELEQAEKCYRRAVEINPNNESFAVSLANIAEVDSQGAGKTNPAEQHTPTAVTRDGNRLSSALMKAEVHLGLGEADAARRLVETALTQMPAQAELELQLARICQATGDSAGAGTHNQRAAQIRAARKVQPASYDVSAKRPGSTGDDPAAITVDKRIEQSTFPGNAKSAEQPSSSASAAASRARTSVEETLRRGETALAADTPAAARSFFKRAIAAAPDDEGVAVSAAVAALRHNHPEMAAELAQSSLPRWPKSAALYRTLGMAEYRLEHWQAAQAALRQALSLDNSHALSYFLLGCTLKKLGQDEEAEHNFSQAKQLDTRYALKP